MALNIVSGRYTATYAGASVGQSSEGIKLSHRAFKRAVRGDAGAEMKQDSIYRGMQVDGDLRLIEYGAPGTLGMMWPYAATYLDPGIIGRADVASGIAKPLILTAIAGALATPNTITIPLACLADGFPVDLLFAPDLREVPIKLDIYAGAITGGGGPGTFGTQT